MSSSKQSWTVIVACYNEQESIRKVVDRIVPVLKKIADESEILIVDDGSSDNSKEIIHALENTYTNVRGIWHERNRGIGAVLRSGYFNAQYDNVSTMAGDGQFNPEELLNVNPIKDETFVCFYRTNRPQYTPFRKFLSAINKSINRYFIGLDLKDVNWSMIFRKAGFKDLDLNVKSSLVKSEIAAKLVLKGYNPVEVPSIYHDRIGGTSKGSSLKTIIQALKDVLRLFMSVRKFKRETQKK